MCDCDCVCVCLSVDMSVCVCICVLWCHSRSLLIWHSNTYFAAICAVGPSPKTIGSLLPSSSLKIFFSLMSSYFGHFWWKCTSVSTSPVVQWPHILRSFGSQDFIRLLFSMLRLWSPSLYLVRTRLCFVSRSVTRYSANSYSRFKGQVAIKLV